MEFKIGNKVDYDNDNNPEIIEEINSKGEINGRYCRNNELSGIFANPKKYKLIERKKGMSKYDEIKSKIEALSNGWDKEADDILQEIQEHCNYCLIIYDYAKDENGFITVKDDNNAWKTPKTVEGVSETTFWFSNKKQCEKLEAFKKALLWLLNHSDIKKSIVGEEKKIEIDGKIYKAKILEEV